MLAAFPGIIKSAPSGSAMASDTNKLYWYAPDSVQHTSGVITSWDDKGPNGYDLGQIASLNMPSYNTGGDYVEFDGTEIIGDTTISTMLLDGLDNNTDDAALFVVAYQDNAAQASSTSGFSFAVCEGTGTSGNNSKMALGLRWETFGTSTTQVEWRNRQFSSAFAVTGAANSSFDDTVLLIQATSTQTSADIDVNDGTETASDTVTTANFVPATATGLSFGGVPYSSDTLIDEPLTGRIYEVFATTDASTSNVDAIRAELKAKYGL